MFQNRFQRTSMAEFSSRPISPNYNISCKIGSGKYGTVFKGVDKSTGKVVALKKINTEKEANGFPKTALREINLLKQINHPNIVSLIEVVTRCEETKNITYLVLEHMDYDLVQLRDKKVSFTQSQLKYIMFQILTGIAYLHSQGVYHRDLKPNNVLYNNRGEVKICDLGMANEYRKNRPQTGRVLIASYRAPEVYLGQHYNCAVDVWSAGILFIELFLKHSPFQVLSSESQCFQQIVKLCGTPNEDLWPGVTKLPKYHDFVKEHYPRSLRAYLHANCNKDPLLIDLVDKMLTLNPDVRITADDALNHPYFEGNIIVPLPKIDTLTHSRPSCSQDKPIMKQNKIEPKRFIGQIAILKDL